MGNENNCKDVKWDVETQELGEKRWNPLRKALFKT